MAADAEVTPALPAGFVLDRREPPPPPGFVVQEAGRPKPEPQATPENPTSALNLGGAAIEPMASLATGAIAAPVSGIAGLVTSAMKALGLTEKEPGDVVRKVGSAMTYEPKTTGGKNALSVIASPFEKLAEGADWAGGKVSDKFGPAAGAAVNTAIQAIPQALIAKGMGKVAPVERAPNNPNINPDVKLLADKGVTMTPGEILGKGASKFEQRLSSFPIAGDVIGTARGKGIEQFGVAAVNDALAPLGETVPAGLKGSKAVEWAYGKFNDAYDSLIPKLSGDLNSGIPPNRLPAPGQLGQPPKPTFRQELENIRQMADSLPPQEKKYLNGIIDDEVIGKFTPQGKATGATLKEIQETLRREADDFRHGGPYDRKLAGGIDEVAASMRRMLGDVNPGYAQELAAIDKGYGIFKIAQRAAASPGTEKGVFTPSQYKGAVRASDKSKDKGRFSEGNARQQDFAEAGKSVLSQSVPDSGTAGRYLLLDAILGHHGAMPSPAGWAAGATLPFIYNQPTLRGIQSLLLRPPAAGHAAARAIPLGGFQQGQLEPPPQ